MESVSSGEMLDLAAFDRLFGEYRPRFIRFAASYVTDAAVAEDIVMESFMAAWERRALLSERSLPPYVLVIVRNKCLNHLRARQVRLRAEERLHSHGARMLELRISTLEACEPAQLFSDEARRLVNETLDRLPDRTREVFVRSRFRGESYKEIAVALGTTVKSVEFEISKAMRSLRVSLKDYLPLLVLFLLIDK